MKQNSHSCGCSARPFDLDRHVYKCAHTHTLTQRQSARPACSPFDFHISSPSFLLRLLLLPQFCIIPPSASFSSSTALSSRPPPPLSLLLSQRNASQNPDLSSRLLSALTTFPRSDFFFFQTASHDRRGNWIPPTLSTYKGGSILFFLFFYFSCFFYNVCFCNSLGSTGCKFACLSPKGKCCLSGDRQKMPHKPVLGFIHIFSFLLNKEVAWI